MGQLTEGTFRCGKKKLKWKASKINSGPRGTEVFIWDAEPYFPGVNSAGLPDRSEKFHFFGVFRGRSTREVITAFKRKYCGPGKKLPSPLFERSA